MIVAKKQPVGLDFEIDRIQSQIYTLLTDNCNWNNYESYHRAYKNYVSDGLIPEVYTRKGEYKEVLPTDKFNATSFFIDEDNEEITLGNIGRKKVSIIFQLNLKKLYSNVLHRADQEAQQDVINALTNINANFEVQKLTQGFSGVYSDFNLNKIFTANVKNADMSYLHYFKVDLEITFNMSKKCNV